MQRKNRMLSLIDFSEYVETTLQYTRRFSAYLNAEVVLIHQLPGIVPARASANVREQFYKNEREDTYERLVGLAGPLFESMPAMIASEKRIADTLHNLKNPDYFDWLFIGIKGTSFFEQLLLGSKAVEVLEESDFVSVAVPLGRELCFPKELVIAIDPDAPFDSHRLKKVLSQLPGNIRNLAFLSITPDKEESGEAKTTLAEVAAQFEGYTTSTIVLHSGNEVKEIERYMNDRQDSYLVLQAGDPETHDFIFKKGLVTELVYKSIVPMIVLPRKLEQDPASVTS
ncbi:universal stress protein [Flavisolibacter sp. BT320]|nr:universal stress protein [Flavisolibacter longurius]